MSEDGIDVRVGFYANYVKPVAVGVIDNAEREPVASDELTMLDRDIANSMIADLDDPDGQDYLPSRVAQQFRYALAELDLAHEHIVVMRTDAWRALTDDQRHELTSMCCRGCGSLDLGCCCENDE